MIKPRQCMVLTPVLYCLSVQDPKSGMFLVGIGDSDKKIGR